MRKEKSESNELEKVSGGQLGLDDVMGVSGLSMCTGSPTENNPEGVFWTYHGISLTKNEALTKLKEKATKSLNPEYTAEAFLDKYIQAYNDQVNGPPICLYS